MPGNLVTTSPTSNGTPYPLKIQPPVEVEVALATPCDFSGMETLGYQSPSLLSPTSESSLETNCLFFWVVFICVESSCCQKKKKIVCAVRSDRFSPVVCWLVSATREWRARRFEQPACSLITAFTCCKPRRGEGCGWGAAGWCWTCTPIL